MDTIAILKGKYWDNVGIFKHNDEYVIRLWDMDDSSDSATEYIEKEKFEAFVEELYQKVFVKGERS